MLVVWSTEREPNASSARTQRLDPISGHQVENVVPQAEWLWGSLVSEIKFWRFAFPDIGDHADELSSSFVEWMGTCPLEMAIPAGQDNRDDGGLPPVKVRTDPAADPLTNRSIVVAWADALCYSDITIVRVDFKLSGFPTKCWFDEKVRIDGQLFPSSTAAHFGDNPTFDYLIGCETGPLAKSVQHVDALFVPNIHMGRVSRFDEVWGRTIIFRNIPLSRRELGFSLTKWRAEQKKRDEMAAKIKAELAKPDQ